MWLRKRDLAFYYFFNEIFLPCRVPTCPPAGAKTWYNMVVTRVSHACLLIEPNQICVSGMDTITVFVYVCVGGGGRGTESRSLEASGISLELGESMRGGSRPPSRS